MSFHLVGLCVAILEDHFGFYVSRVGNLLLRAQLPLMLLAKQLAQAKITLREVKRSLAILDQHNLLQFQSTPRAVLYSISSENILHLIQAPRAILFYAIKTLYEGAVEAIFEDILAQGRASCSDCIRRVSDKFLDDLPVDKVKEAFVRLAEAQIIIRCERLVPEEDQQQQQQRQQHPLIASTSSSSSAAECPQFEPEPDPFLMPHVILDAKVGNNNNGDEAATGAAGNGTAGTVASGSSSSRKRKRGDQQQQQRDSDTHILWRINWVRMGRFFRDEIILDAIGSSGGNELLDKPTLRAAQLLLKVGEMRSPLEAGQSTPISLQDVCRYMREHHIDHQYSRELIDEKLSIIGKDITGIVRRVGDSGGGLYIINYEKGIETLCLEHIESAIRERIGDRAVRIFRLLRSKEFLEEEQVEKEAMLSSKETKELCCALMDHSFITTRQIARANDFAPARTIFLYSVNMAQVLGSMVQFTAMVIRNVIRRRMLEREKHEQLLERQLKMEVIISSITTNPSFTEEDEQTRKEQIAEVEQAYLTADDRRRLDRFRLAERRFWSTEIELERLHFALLQFQQIRQRSNAEQQRLQASQRGRRRRTTAAAATAAAPVLMSVETLI